ncbi:MAG: hypothetical protein HY516_00335 [Candidatus Aenigmarchaeota archaeon]|nr:hypothetical protein [Candidatus Aenigmarchaeota archaeon]
MIYFTMAKRLDIDATDLLQLPISAYATFRAIDQPPFLSPGDARPNYPKCLAPVPDAYYGIGGDKETYRTLISVIGLKKYKESVKEFCGSYPSAILYDAYPYDLLNRIDGYDQPKDVWKAFRDLMEKKRSETGLKIARRRGIYQRMAELAGTKIRYVGADWLLEKPEYENILFGLLNSPSLPDWEPLVPAARRNNPASLLYMPMEIAEALVLKQEFGVRLKIGDKKEKGFDGLIYREDKDWLFAYTPPAITKTGNRPPYRNADDINFDMTLEEAAVFLKDVMKRAPAKDDYSLRRPTAENLQFGAILGELDTDAIGGNFDYRAGWGYFVTLNAFLYVKNGTGYTNSADLLGWKNGE